MQSRDVFTRRKIARFHQPQHKSLFLCPNIRFVASVLKTILSSFLYGDRVRLIVVYVSIEAGISIFRDKIRRSIFYKPHYHVVNDSSSLWNAKYASSSCACVGTVKILSLLGGFVSAKTTFVRKTFLLSYAV